MSRSSKVNTFTLLTQLSLVYMHVITRERTTLLKVITTKCWLGRCALILRWFISVFCHIPTGIWCVWWDRLHWLRRFEEIGVFYTYVVARYLKILMDSDASRCYQYCVLLHLRHLITGRSPSYRLHAHLSTHFAPDLRLVCHFARCA